MIQTHFGLSWAKISQTTLFPWHERMRTLQGITIPWTHPEQLHPKFMFANRIHVVEAAGLGPYPLLPTFTREI